MMKRTEVRGKRGQKVAILNGNDIQQTLDVLNSVRNAAGLSSLFVSANANSSNGRPVGASD
jgi:hypothetical protein